MAEHHNVDSVKTYEYRNDIRTYKRLKGKTPNPKIHNNITDLEKKAFETLHDYKEDKLTVNPDDYKAFAEYIDTFGHWHEELLNKLNDAADFDVYKYLADSKRKWNQGFFDFFASKTQYFSAKKLKTKADQYRKLMHKQEHDTHYNQSDYEKITDLEEEANTNIENFMNGSLQIKPKDVETLKSYFDTFKKAFYNSNTYEHAVKRLETMSNNTHAQTGKLAAFGASIKNGWQSIGKLFKFSLPKFSMPKIKFPKFSLPKFSMPKIKFPKFSMPKFSLPKIKLPSFSMPKFSSPKLALKPQLSLSEKSKRNLKRTAGVVGGAALLSVLTFGGLKADQGSDDKNANKVEQNAGPKQNLEQNQEKTFVWGQNAEQNNAPEWQAFQTQNGSENKTREYTSEQKVWQNFYNTKSNMQANALHLDISELNKKIQKQAEKGIFTMPENTISEQLVYTHVMYKVYGLPSPIDNVLSATQKLSDAQQKAVEQAIVTAGKDGKGVRKIAQSVAAKKGQKLGKYSAFDHASKQQKNKYITNLKQVRALNHHTR